MGREPCLFDLTSLPSFIPYYRATRTVYRQRTCSGDVRVNFGDIGGIGWVVESYIATPEGRNAVKKYLTSPEGSAMLQKFVGTPEGKETIVSILPHIPGWLNLPPGSADTIRGALGSTQ